MARKAATYSIRLLLQLLLAGAGSGFAQSLGDIAPKGRQQSAGQPQRAVHVYTNEDLARPQILLPEDRARLQAAASEQDNGLVAPAAGSTEMPLGDIARIARARKRAFQQQSETNLQSHLLPGTETERPNHPETVQRPLTRDQKPVTITLRLRGSEIPLGDIAPIAREPQSWDQSRPERKRILGTLLAPVAKPIARKSRKARPKKALANAWGLGAKVTVKAGPLSRGRRGRSLAPSRSVTSRSLELTARVRIRPGDSLWSIAKRYFKKGARWREIASANPQLADSNHIVAGQWLKMPAPSTPDGNPRSAGVPPA